MVKVLFICLGNICRSPSAEAVMKAFVEKINLSDKIIVDSAGIMGWHSGEPADARMRKHAVKRGYNLTSISRQFNPDKDFENFDYVIAMDYENMSDLRSMDKNNLYKDKLHMMTEFNGRISADIVPDPYYGGEEGFENVLDILEDACEGLLEDIRKKYNL